MEQIHRLSNTPFQYLRKNCWILSSAPSLVWFNYVMYFINIRKRNGQRNNFDFEKHAWNENEVKREVFLSERASSNETLNCSLLNFKYN